MPSFLQWCTLALRGETAPTGGEERVKELTAQCATKEGTIAMVQSTTDGFAAALAAAPEDSLTKLVMAPFGLEMAMFMICQIAVNHIWYHDGQLNYIHCLLGDDKMYWMGE